MTFRKVSQSLLDIDPNSLGGGSVEVEPLQYQRHSFVTNGTDDTYTAPFTLEGVGLLVFVGSTYQPESTYTVEGSDITFVEVPDEGIAIELVVGDGFGSKVNIPAAFGVPYPTNEELDGRTVWACRIDCGLVANLSTKLVDIPAFVLSEAEYNTIRIVDVQHILDGEDRSSPYLRLTSSFNGGTYVYRDGDSIIIVTTLNWTIRQTVEIIINYTKQEQ